ncbi:MAG: SAM-dependent methyltransferase, partial [Betaproteobacteria bacterium]
MHGAEAPSEWVARWAQLVTRGPVLDVASGAGRHAR